jgi:glycosyltransferase involved in cell wall biosynthesis
MPKVSIITPCYRAERFIGRTIESVQRQTYRDWEHVIVDDGSPDTSAEIVRTYMLVEPRLKLTQQTNSGVACSRNVGYAQIHPDSEYLIFLDADDMIDPQTIEVMVDYLEMHPDAGVLHCGRVLVDENDDAMSTDKFRCQRFIPVGGWVRELRDDQVQTPFVSLFCLAVVIPSLCVIRRSVYGRTTGWDEDFGQPCEDTDLFLRLALMSEIHYLARPFIKYRRHTSQSTQNIAHYDRQKLKLHRKWLGDTNLTPTQRKEIWNAWHFYEGKVKPFLFLSWGIDHYRRRAYREGLKSQMRSVKQVINYLSLVVEYRGL